MNNLDPGEIVTIICVTIITVIAIVLLKGQGTEIAAGGLGGLVGFLTKANSGGNHEVVE